ncbi:hypothetical protein B0T11DRAFT_301338 [Plectosphaerella cucumerina]|uniref:Uncharacterized protein n=1 Tax=Plectosphaerella cucumerina TaxID=40658 RepID=A0A8K0TAK2_9PEZI|nr:hypothetical protein B0T11DRAFT_301338 [Plectosphaerella cucumerina]
MEGNPNPQPLFRAKFEDLTAEEKHIGDHIFPLLEKCNRTTTEVNDANREILWNKVFKNWDTTKPIIKPKFPRRAVRASSIPVGTLIGDCPVPVPAVGTDTHIPAERRAHAEVFLNITVNRYADHFNFRYTDARHKFVPPNMVQLREGLTISNSRRMVADHYDEHERKRVQTFNGDLVVYWFRQHLVAKMEDDAAGSPELSQKKQDRDFDYGQLVQLKLARDVLDLIRSMVDLERMNAINPV